MNIRRYGLRVILISLFSLTIYTLCIAEDSSDGMVTGRSVRLRAGPNCAAGILRILNKGMMVEVLEKSSYWYKVKLENGNEGWIYQKYITTQTTEIENRVALVDQARELGEFAKRYLGFKYAYGGIGPSWFDCSGYTMFIYGKFGYKLPHSASSQMNLGEGVKRMDLDMGDLLFFKTMRSPSINHVGIYLGNGSFIHAASGAGRIRIDSVFNHYYSSRYWGARRILVYSSKKSSNSK